MASDLAGAGRVAGNAVSLIINCSSETEINAFFAGLAAGGTVTDPLSEKFWGDTFGALTDQFGVNWLLDYNKNQNA